MLGFFKTAYKSPPFVPAVQGPKPITTESSVGASVGPGLNGSSCVPEPLDFLILKFLIGTTELKATPRGTVFGTKAK